jgi:ATP-dependent exoDNAse (exonuclease V) alpha subunit
MHARSREVRGSVSSPTEVLVGLVERVTFHNNENRFCVLRVNARAQRDLITITGHAAMISAGEFVQASGTWVNDRTHGVQFRASFLKAAAPTTIEGIEKYLGSGMIRGIGPIYAKKLVRAFGDAVFDVIEKEPSRLREVTGIGPKRAERIVGEDRGDRPLRSYRPCCQAPLREHWTRNEDDSSPARDRSADRQLSAQCGGTARLRSAGRRRDLDGRCPADARCVSRFADPGGAAARW